MIWYSSRYAFQAWYLKVNRTVPQIAKIASFSQIIICVCIELQQQHHHQRFNQNQPIYLLSVFVCFMQFLPSRPMRLPRRFFYFISKMHRCENVRKVLFGEKEKRLRDRRRHHVVFVVCVLFLLLHYYYPPYN